MSTTRGKRGRGAAGSRAVNRAVSGELDSNLELNNTGDSSESQLDDVNTVTLTIGELRTVIRNEVTKIVNSLKLDLALRFDDLDTQFSDLNRTLLCKIDDAMKDVKQLKDDQKKTETIVPCQTIPVLDGVEIRVTDAIAEQQAKYEKRNNLIFFGVPEPQEDGIDFKEHDTKIVHEVHSELKIKPTADLKITRIGRKGPRPRPILVKYLDNDKDTRTEVLRKAKNLRTLPETDERKKIYIHPDLTKAEQDAERILHSECKRRRAAGEDVIVRRGKVQLRNNIDT